VARQTQLKSANEQIHFENGRLPVGSPVRQVNRVTELHLTEATSSVAKLNGILGPIVPVILAYLVFGSILLALYHKLLEKPVAALQHSATAVAAPGSPND
jgi:hypothetical protein